MDDTITYSISYYNNANTSATITITDKLDSGLTFVEASDGGAVSGETTVTESDGSTWNYGGTVTWTLTVDAFTSGSVTVTVLVNSNARSISSGETVATVDNQATVYNAKTEHTATTNTVTNPLEDDEDEATEKGIISVTYYEDGSTTQSTRSDRDDNGNIIVQEGDQIHYIISRYNNTNESVTFVIVDTLDEGVTYAYSSSNGTYYDSATTVTVGSDTYSIPARSVVWIVSTNPFSYATVQMTVIVNSSAKTATQTYDAGVPNTYSTSDIVADYTDYTYGETNTTASVANQAVAYTVGNDVVSYSNVIENPLDDDEPVAPTKTEPYRTATAEDGDLDEDGNVVDKDNDGFSNDTVTYGSVDIGDIVEYRINYYNNYNSQATITIVDKLDDDVELVFTSLVDEGETYNYSYDDSTGIYTWELYDADNVVYETITYDSSTRTITWKLTVEPLTSGYVEFMVTVQKTAVKDATEYPDDEGTIVNSATVTNNLDNGNSYTTNTVVNPVDDTPAEPKKEVASSSAGADGDNVKVDDEITYVITYYNHNSEEATITIVDTLDPNVELVDATDQNDNSLYDGITGAARYLVDSVAGKVTWSFTAEAYETGTVSITVRVKEGAQGKTVNNSATVSVNNESKTTTETENPVDDDPVDPTKLESGDATSGLDSNGKVEDSDDDGYLDDETVTYGEVKVDDEITYTISYYNHYGVAADVTITDVLESGLTYVSSSDDGVYTSTTRTVSWTIEDVNPYTAGTVTLTVKVNSSAKTVTTGETTATVDNQASVTVTEDDDSYSRSTNVVVNPLADDEPTDPTKTEVEVLDNSTGQTHGATVDTTETDPSTGETTITYKNEVAVGDVITYQIDYTNHVNAETTITITDVLEDGLTFVSASDNGTILDDTDTDTQSVATDSEGNELYKYGGTVTWTLTVEPYGTGTVTLKVMVNENAKTVDTGDTVADVENSATETNSLDPGHEYNTNVVVNELEDDDPEAPEKTLTSVTYADTNDKDTEDDNGNLYVHVGDTVTYTIKYYNNLNETATVKVVDVLDEGVTYVSSNRTNTVTGEQTATDSDGVEYKYGGTVTWTISDVPALSGGTVTLTVKVNEKATASTNTYDVQGDDDYVMTYGETNTTASIANQASTTVTNQATYYSNVVENPLEDEDPEDPVKTETSTTDPDTSTDTPATNPTEGKRTDGDDTYTTYTYDTVGVGKIITYTISYYNNYNTQATITIEDELDDGVKFVTASDGGAVGTTEKTGTYSDGTVYTYGGTVTWTLTVEPLTHGTVTVQVLVLEAAKTITTSETVATVENQATVYNDQDDSEGTTGNKTNIVINPIDPDEPDNSKVVSADSAAGVDNANVKLGDKITYTISYYNHTNTTAKVTIVDELDNGVDFVSATGDTTVNTAKAASISEGGTENYVTYATTTDSDNRVTTVTWTIYNVAPYATGTVDLIVEVNETASTTANGYQVENDADVTIGDPKNTYTTDLVINPVDDEPESPEKELESVTYTDETSGETTERTTKDDSGNLYVSVGDTVTYSIDYYNYLNEVATVTIEDVLDEGVTFVTATGDTTVDTDKAASLSENGTKNYVTYTTSTDAEGITTVTWTVYNADALEWGNVELTVTVNENAKASENTYDVQGDDDYVMTYGETNTTASIANQAGTTVSSARVTNQATYYSNVVENPLEEEDPVDPVKTAETVEEEDVEPTVTEDSDGTEIHEYDTVSVGETVTYTISYYNHHNTAATITIVDPLDEGLTVDETSITDGGVYDADTHTITWTLTVEPLSGGTVSFQAMVNENAKTINTAEETVATVENGATETNSEDTETGHEYTTNIVVHPIDPDDPSDPQKFVSTTSEAGVGGANVTVGDQITYVITYYNHTNTTADVTIVDTLMDGVTFVESDTVTYELGENEDGLVTVTWTIADVAPYTGGTVYLTVEVTDDALTVTQVENDAEVTIGDNEYTTDLVINPVDDVPQDPVKSVDVGDGETISAGDKLTYTITYYNNLGTAADVTITDELDSDVTYVSSSNGGVYDSDTHTVTWTIEDVTAYTEGSVTLTVKVKSGATGTIKNIANVQIADGETQETVSDDDTNEVVNPISTTTSSKSGSPKTGDFFRLTLWVLLLAGSAAGLLALYFRRKSSDDAE